MMLSAAPDREVDTTIVIDAGEDEVLEVMERWYAEDELDPGALDQLVEYSRREARACGDRLLGVRSSDGQLVAMSKLRGDGRTAQVEDVYTAPEARGRGFGRAVVTRAVELARDAGHDLIFITPTTTTGRRSCTRGSASGRSAGSGSSTAADAPSRGRSGRGAPHGLLLERARESVFSTSRSTTARPDPRRRRATGARSSTPRIAPVAGDATLLATAASTYRWPDRSLRAELPIARPNSRSLAQAKAQLPHRSGYRGPRLSPTREAGMKRKLEMLVPAVLLSAVLAVGVAAVAVAASSPAVTTGTHSHVTDTSAVLHGTINPNGSATTYYFEWGLTTAYGVTSVAHSAGHGTKPVAVSADRGRADPGHGLPLPARGDERRGHARPAPTTRSRPRATRPRACRPVPPRRSARTRRR